MKIFVIKIFRLELIGAETSSLENIYELSLDLANAHRMNRGNCELTQLI